jgi:hypothetical protein
MLQRPREAGLKYSVPVAKCTFQVEEEECNEGRKGVLH